MFEDHGGGVMTGEWKEVVRLHFKGERFRDHALDLSALSELRQFQKMVAETAKALWRKGNPDRERLPRNFEDRTRLCLRRIEEGSATAPLEVFIEEPEQGELWEPEPVEVNDAISLAYRVFGAVHEDISLPEEFPKELLTEYAKWGQELENDEVLEFVPPGKNATRVTEYERKRLIDLAESPYEDEVDVLGQVLEADVRQKKFQLWSDDRKSIHVFFTEDQENEVTTALKDHNVVHLRVIGRGEFSPQGELKRIVNVDTLLLVRDEQPIYDSNAPAIEKVLAELAKEVPNTEWNKLPQDLTNRLDYYLYGSVKE
jgi:hypothetical protein